MRLQWGSGKRPRTFFYYDGRPHNMYSFIDIGRLRIIWGG